MFSIDFQPIAPPIQTHLEIGRGCLNNIRPAGPAALIADQAVEPAARRLAQSLGAELLLLSGGKLIKTRETKQRLEDELLKRRFGRDALFIGMGGGAVTDLVSFLASTYMRGVSLILIPTTLLGMVDAAIGGKTAIDTPAAKNAIGSFYHPQAIYIDPEFLQTLPDREKRNGLAEMLKIGLVLKREIWDRLAAGVDPELLIGACVEGKLSVVQKDPQEKGLRRILNFGHTIGHAIEQQSDYRIAHGEAVAMGCVAESRLSAALGYLPEQTAEEIASVYRRLGFALEMPAWSHRFWEALTLDKKSAAREPRFVLIDRIGHALEFEGAYCRSMPKNAMIS